MPAQRFACLPNHFTAYVHRVYFAEEFGKRFGDASGAATDLEYPHTGRWLSLADVAHIGQDLFGHGPFAGGKELLVGPLGVRRIYVVAGILAGALVPIGAHLLQLVLQVQLALQVKLVPQVKLSIKARFVH
jgi:hypothetical protein